MKWKPGGRSSNLEDQRGASGGGGGFGFGKLGLGGIAIIVVVALVTKQNPLALIGAMQDGGAVAPGAPQAVAPVADPAEEPMVEFVSWVLDDAQNTWNRIFTQSGQPYSPAKLVLFRNNVSSGCGYAQAAMGPFYCPADRKVYIDLGFYSELDRRFGAPGDFAQAYVLAHEVGHHVQTLLGTNDQVRRAQQRSPEEANPLSVKLELQADCYAGVWAHSTARRDLLEPGDIEEGLAAAAAVGDDRIQKQATGDVQPESFTHGSSADRMTWFKTGFESGDPQRCDTFGR